MIHVEETFDSPYSSEIISIRITCSQVNAFGYSDLAGYDSFKKRHRQQAGASMILIVFLAIGTSLEQMRPAPSARVYRYGVHRSKQIRTRRNHNFRRIFYLLQKNSLSTDAFGKAAFSFFMN
ncbi:hypothetical protein [uncultured Dubosiella sp.]|uniref:hypothetical protein n=1 Tax=uncultured Dubosiella sp. TaxID=1937011 RepID=UPI002582A8E2|nr:hypothetical protein [uncultured Dubosiella sp.]